MGVAVKSLHDRLVNLLDEQDKAYRTLATTYRSELGDLSAEVKQALTAHRDHISQFDNAAKTAAELAATFAKSVRDSNGAIGQLQTAVVQLNANLKTAADAIVNLPSQTADAFKELAEAATESREAAARIKTDVTEVDQIIGELINLLGRRMSGEALRP